MEDMAVDVVVVGEVVVDVPNPFVVVVAAAADVVVVVQVHVLEGPNSIVFVCSTAFVPFFVVSLCTSGMPDPAAPAGEVRGHS